MWHYIMTQVILTFWLVLAYDLLEDKRMIDAIMECFSRGILRWQNILRI